MRPAEKGPWRKELRQQLRGEPKGRHYDRRLADSIRREASISTRQIEQGVEAMLRQGYLDDPASGAYDLPVLVAGFAEVIEIGE
jgi:hypothetical protein